MAAKKLSEEEIRALLPKMKGWSVVDGKLHREIACKDFVTAFGNMTRVALVAPLSPKDHESFPRKITSLSCIGTHCG